MVKKLAYCILHYGKPFFKYAVEAIYPQVDKIVILYTPKPSQGFQTELECPDTRQELYDDIAPFMDKIEWVDGEWENEGLHTDAIAPFREGFNWLIRFDSDEIYPEGSVDNYIKQAEKTPLREFRIPFLHFWRSFKWVCKDAQWPIRLYRIGSGEGLGWVKDEPRVFHMSYAQPTKYITYKMEVQAHRLEWRPDWFEKKWLTNAKEDIHPVSFLPTPLWNAEEFKGELPAVLEKHPYFLKERIE